MQVKFRYDQLTSYSICLTDGSWRTTTAQGSSTVFNLIER